MAEGQEGLGEEALKDVEEAINEINDDMREALEDNPDLQKTLQKSLEEIKKAVKNADATCLDDAVNEVVDKLGPCGHPCAQFEQSGGLTDSKVLLELQEAERQAQQTATIITELKQSVAQLLEKPHMTDLENIELEQKNKQLAALLQDFENRTRQIQMIVSHIDKKAQGGYGAIGPMRGTKAIKDEDMLPKVIICGTTENNMPKIIICDADKKKKPKCGSGGGVPPLYPPPAASVMPQFARRLNESYNMQEKLAAENADLEGKRYQLQEEIINKDQTVESLRQKVNCLQSELRVVVKENTLLAEKLNKIGDKGGPGSSCGSVKGRRHSAKAEKQIPTNMACCPGKGICPGDVESRLQNYSNTTNVLEKQLGQMEQQVKCMQAELENVQRERAALEQQRRSAAPPSGGRCQGPCAPQTQTNSNASSGCGQPRAPGGGYHLAGGGGTAGNGPRSAGGGCLPNGEQQLRELREQYCRLQEDYKNKLSECATLRADSENLKQQINDAELCKEQAIQLVKEKEREIKMLQLELNKIAGNKEMQAEQEQQLILTRQKLREAQDELDELRAIVGDQTAQLEDYRNKYLQAQQLVEEQRRQIDMMEMENQRISDQVNLEIQRVKNQFQEKLQELTPLPDILKATQLKLQESQQLQICAERNAEKLEMELQRAKDREMQLCLELEKMKQERENNSSGADQVMKKLQCCEKKLEELKCENDQAKLEICRLEELNAQAEKRIEEKMHEICQLNSQLEQLREESARQVARAKERADTIRRSLQSQISDMERQLAQSRANCRSAQKERDEIRQKMQCQINNLNESFEQAQSRIRSLQGHVNFLKTSYSCMFNETGDAAQADACTCNTTN